MDMALVALLLPERLELPDFAPEKVEAFVRSYDRILERLKNERPPDGSEVERELLLEAIRLNLGLQRDLESSWLDLLRGDLDVWLRELIEAEPASADTERKLSIRFLEQSLDTLGVLIEWVAKLHEELAASGLLAEELTDRLDEVLTEGEPDLDPQSLSLSRWQLDLLVALRCLRSSPEELAWWAKRCATGSRKVSAMLASPALREWRGEVARRRARSSWKRWDDEELERELAPWPDL